MAHFAKLDENNVVVAVHVVHNNELLINGQESEEKGIVFLKGLYGVQTKWKQTSYSKSFRKNYAGIGFVYDPQRDAFIPPKPFSSWSLDEQTCLWVPPTPMPEDGKRYVWDEATLSWIEVGV